MCWFSNTATPSLTLARFTLILQMSKQVFPRLLVEHWSFAYKIYLMAIVAMKQFIMAFERHTAISWGLFVHKGRSFGTYAPVLWTMTSLMGDISWHNINYNASLFIGPQSTYHFCCLYINPALNFWRAQKCSPFIYNVHYTNCEGRFNQAVRSEYTI